MGKEVMTTLERAALYALVDRVRDPMRRDALKQQAETCEVVGRDSNAHGFMSTLVVDRSLPPVVASSQRLGGIGATIRGLEAGAGFAIFLNDGYIDALEGFAYVDFPNDEDRWATTEQFQLHETYRDSDW
jgi:hypothetical protein